MHQINAISNKSSVSSKYQSKERNEKKIQYRNFVPSAQDKITISQEGLRRYKESLAERFSYEGGIYDINEMGKEEWEKATGIKVLDYLESLNRDGTEPSVFQKYQRTQYKVFDQFCEENHIYDSISQETKDKVKNLFQYITEPMDHFGDDTGHRGISEKSVLLTENMISQLEYIKDKLIPDSIKEQFGQLIEECAHFNQKSREKMFCDSMPSDILLERLSSGLQNKTKREVVTKHITVCREARQQYKDNLSACGNKDTTDIDKAVKYLEKQYRKRHSQQETTDLMNSIKESWNCLFMI